MGKKVNTQMGATRETFTRSPTKLTRKKSIEGTQMKQLKVMPSRLYSESESASERKRERICRNKFARKATATSNERSPEASRIKLNRELVTRLSAALSSIPMAAKLRSTESEREICFREELNGRLRSMSRRIGRPRLGRGSSRISSSSSPFHHLGAIQTELEQGDDNEEEEEESGEGDGEAGKQGRSANKTTNEKMMRLNKRIGAPSESVAIGSRRRRLPRSKGSNSSGKLSTLTSDGLSQLLISHLENHSTPFSWKISSSDDIFAWIEGEDKSTCFCHFCRHPQRPTELTDESGSNFRPTRTEASESNSPVIRIPALERQTQVSPIGPQEGRRKIGIESDSESSTSKSVISRDENEDDDGEEEEEEEEEKEKGEKGEKGEKEENEYHDEEAIKYKRMGNQNFPKKSASSAFQTEEKIANRKFIAHSDLATCDTHNNETNREKFESNLKNNSNGLSVRARRLGIHFFPFLLVLFQYFAMSSFFIFIAQAPKVSSAERVTISESPLALQSGSSSSSSSSSFFDIGLSSQRQPELSSLLDEPNESYLATVSSNSDPYETSQVSNGSMTSTNSRWTQDLSNVTDGSNLSQTESTSLFESFLNVGRIFIMTGIIVGDICGNSLVILSVCRHSKLRVTTNWFVVSLACADILVALFAMTFSASIHISGKWLFKPWVCDFWNSCDVLASTASILHLCCISIDRYIAIMRPLDYAMKITTKRVMYALCGVWISSALLSYIPIFTGIYTTSEHIQWRRDNPDQCEFVVNRVYAIVSSSISFWIPACIMVFTYYRIYKEATRQEKFIYKAQNMMPAPNHQSSQHHGKSHHHHHQQHSGANHSGSRSKQRRSKSMSGSSQTSSSRGRANVAPKQQQPSRISAQQAASPPPLQQPQGSQQQQQQQQQQQHQQQQLQSEHKVSDGSQQNAEIAITKMNGDQSSENQPLASSLDQQGANTSARQQQQQQLEIHSGGTTATTTTTMITAGGAGGVSSGTTNQTNNDNQNNTTTATTNDDEDDGKESNSGQSTPTKRSISKMKREHKAAKTLGIIMGVFVLCWLPFFSWYTPMHICGHACDGIIPHEAVTILFWIGYFNSTLNPIIYAYFNHEFRDAFKKTLQWIFCCCQDLKCLRVNRANDNQHYNCTYRSTQEIVLVSNG